MADQMFPVCSPSLLTGPNPLKTPEDLARFTLLHTSGYADDWRVWLTAAGQPASIAKNPGLTFDLSFMTVQAAVDGIGIAIGHTAFVEDDIANGRLVAPFDMRLPEDAGYYFVAPQDKALSPKIVAFREWLMATVTK
jgi:LysR family glycine cleavage system transcriptional activator